MSFELKDGYGQLFKNGHKSSSDSPDYTGAVKVGGVEYQLAGWIKEGKKGKFMSLSIQPKGTSRGRDA